MHVTPAGALVVCLIADNHASKLAFKMAKCLLRPRDELQLLTIVLDENSTLYGNNLLVPYTLDPCFNTVKPVVGCSPLCWPLYTNRQTCAHLQQLLITERAAQSQWCLQLMTTCKPGSSSQSLHCTWQNLPIQQASSTLTTLLPNQAINDWITNNKLSRAQSGNSRRQAASWDRQLHVIIADTSQHRPIAQLYQATESR
jgi:hypothetical protein